MDSALSAKNIQKPIGNKWPVQNNDAIGCMTGSELQFTCSKCI